MVLSGLVAFIGATTNPGAVRAAEGPWQIGVSEEQRQVARARFNQGLTWGNDGFFTHAVDNWRASLAAWDHPAIHFNLGLSLLHLGEPVDAVKHLWLAMKHGGAPLNLENVAKIRRYAQRVIEDELTHLVVSSELPGRVLLGQTTLFEGPGNWEGFVRSGETQLSVEGNVPNAGTPQSPLLSLTVKARAGHESEVRLVKDVRANVVERVLSPQILASVQTRMLGFEVAYPKEKHVGVQRPPAEDPLDRCTGDTRPFKRGASA